MVYAGARLLVYAFYECFPYVRGHRFQGWGHPAGDYLFNGNYTSGLRVVDVSDVANAMCLDGRLNELAYIDTEPRLNSFSGVLTFDVSANVTLQSFSDFAGIWGNYPYFESGHIVMSDFFNGLFSVELDLPE